MDPKLKNECNFLRAVQIFIIYLLPLLRDPRRRNCTVCLERLHGRRTEVYIITVVVRANRRTRTNVRQSGVKSSREFFSSVGRKNGHAYVDSIR